MFLVLEISNILQIGVTKKDHKLKFQEFHNRSFLIVYFSYLGSDDVQYAPSTLDWLTGLITLVTAGVFGNILKMLY